ncbi:hypothetical protein ACFLTX_02465 [Chloroflexota bacterium]
MSRKKKRKVSSSRNMTRSKSSARVVSNEFNPDYSDIKKELKRIAVLAASFIAILVVLSIFQDQILSFFIK